MLFKVFSFVTLVMMCLCLIGNPNNYQVKPHSLLLYEASGGTNVWFHSYMRCRMRQDEDFTFNRYRTVKTGERVYYENGGTLDVFGDRMTYFGVTNYFCDSRNYLLAPTTNLPHCCIWSCK